MTVFLPRTAVLTGGLAVAAVALSACGADPRRVDQPRAKGAATATTAEAFGGMDALVKAAKKEGTLNAIALPRDWANYGALIDGFKKKYGIKVEVENPDGASQDEINAVTSRKGQDRAPDVLDLGSSFALERRPAGAARAVHGRRLRRHPRRPEGLDRPLVQRLRRLHLHRLRCQARARPARPPSRICSSRSTRGRSRSTATPPSRVRPSAACTRPPSPAAAPSTTSSPASTSSPS